MKKKLFIYNALLVIFALIFVVSGFFLIRELVQRRQAAEYIASLQSEYVPEITSAPDTEVKNPEANTETSENTSPATLDHTSTANPSIERLTADYPDVVGWLTVSGASVSHPFVQTYNNSNYLWAGLDGKYINGGTLFMDYTNSRDLSDKITVIYGHNMRDGSMFGSLLNYLNFDYLLENPDVYISYPDHTAHYTIAACIVVDGANNIVYDNIGERSDVQDIVDFIYENAEVNPECTLTGESNILVLSTCHRSYDTARTLLFCIPD